MRGGAALLAATALLLLPSADSRVTTKRRKAKSLYALKGLVDIGGNSVDLDAYAGKVSLVVNVASQ